MGPQLDQAQNAEGHSVDDEERVEAPEDFRHEEHHPSFASQPFQPLLGGASARALHEMAHCHPTPRNKVDGPCHEVGKLEASSAVEDQQRDGAGDANPAEHEGHAGD